MKQERRDALFKEYTEVGTNFRELTEIRFKLLGLLPLASAATAALGSRDAGGVPLSLALFGLIATVTVLTYHTRNDQLYNALIARAAAIERSLGLADGGYANRPRSWLDLRIGPWVWPVSHGQGVTVVYVATAALWIYLATRAGFRSAGLAPGHPGLHAVLGLLVTALVLVAALGLIKRQQKMRRCLLMRSIRAAVQALTLAHNNLGQAKDDEMFLRACAAAAGRTAREVAAEAEFYAGLEPEALRYYVPASSGLQRSAFLVALLTSMPPAWIFDITSGRRGHAS